MKTLVVFVAVVGIFGACAVTENEREQIKLFCTETVQALKHIESTAEENWSTLVYKTKNESGKTGDCVDQASTDAVFEGTHKIELSFGIHISMLQNIADNIADLDDGSVEEIKRQINQHELDKKIEEIVKSLSVKLERDAKKVVQTFQQCQ